MGTEEITPEYRAERHQQYIDQNVSIAFIILDTFFLAIFYASRYYNKTAVGTTMLILNTICYFLCLGSAVCGILMVQIGGVGIHVKVNSTSTFIIWLKLSKVLEFTYTPAVMCAKLAALSFYLQVFKQQTYVRIIYVVGVIVILNGIAAIIGAFTICRPFRYFWTQAYDINDGKCGDVDLFYKSYSVPSLATDVVMIVLPFPVLLKLQVSRATKIGLILTFLAGSLGIITCILRLVTFFTVPLFEDPTWYASGGPMIYALVEPSIYMIASILPTTRHLQRRLFERSGLSSLARSIFTRTGSPSQRQYVTSKGRISGKAAHDMELEGGRGITKLTEIHMNSSSQEALAKRESQEYMRDAASAKSDLRDM